MAENKCVSYLFWLSSLLLTWYIFFQISIPHFIHIQLKLTNMHNTLSSSYSLHKNNLVGDLGWKKSDLPKVTQPAFMLKSGPDIHPTDILTNPLHLGLYGWFRKERNHPTIKMWPVPRLKDKEWRQSTAELDYTLFQSSILISFPQISVRASLGKSTSRTYGLMQEIMH